jgi:hypothetical protein
VQARPTCTVMLAGSCAVWRAPSARPFAVTAGREAAAGKCRISGGHAAALQGMGMC